MIQLTTAGNLQHEAPHGQARRPKLPAPNEQDWSHQHKRFCLNNNIMVFASSFDLSHDDTCCEWKWSRHIQEFDPPSQTRCCGFWHRRTEVCQLSHEIGNVDISSFEETLARWQFSVGTPQQKPLERQVVCSKRASWRSGCRDNFAKTRDLHDRTQSGWAELLRESR